MYNQSQPIQENVNKLFINNTNILHPAFILINSKKQPQLLELNLDELLTHFTNGVDINSSAFKNMYNKYKHDYIHLTPDLFKIYIQHTLYSSVPFLFQNLEPILQEFYNESKNLRIQLKKYYAEKFIIGSEVKKQLINYKHNKPVYNILNCNVNFNITTSNGGTINLTKLIKEYPLSETVPYMNYNSSIIKTYTGFNFQNEKSYSDRIVLKLRYLNPQDVNVTGKENYALCYIYQNGNVTIKYNFKKTDNINFDNVFEYTKNIFATSKIMKFLNLTKNYQINIKYTIISFEINKNSKYSNIQSNINNEPFQVQPKLKKDILTLKFTSPGSSNGHSIIINNKFVNTKVTAYGFLFESELLVAIDSLLNIFYKTENRKVNIKIGGGKIKNRKLGINTLSCQKIRQPTLIKGPHGPNDGLLGPYTVKTYPLKDPKTNNVFTCNNKNYPYPGFTNVNSICCFKKDQRNKYIFKKNIGAIVNDNLGSFLSDTELLHNPIIKTNKALEPNRIGIFTKLDKLKKFDTKGDKKHENFYRIGNTCGILGAVELLLKKKIDLNKITLTEKVFISLDNGNIANKYKLHDYLNLIKSKLITDGLLELLAYHTQLNFIYVSKKLILHKFNKNVAAYIISDCNEPIININSNKIVRTFDISQFTVFKNELQLLSEKVKINKQFVVNNKVTYISSNYGILPINSSNGNGCGILLDYPITEKFNLPLLNLHKQYECLLQLNFNVIGQFTSKFGSFGSLGSSRIDGLIVNVNQGQGHVLIPTKPSSELINEMKLFYLQFVPSVPSIKKKSKNFALELDIYNEIYERVRYLLNVIQLKFNIISKQVTETEIISILKNYITFADPNIKTIFDIPNVKSICSSLLKPSNGSNNVSNVNGDPFCEKEKLKIPKKYFKGIIKKIVMDINAQNPRGKQIISGKINKEYFNKDNFIKRSVEKIVVNF